MELVPGTRVERYIVESRIGAGRMSTTYRVRHVTLNTSHALTVPNDPGRALRTRLVAGARIQARLRHPHLIAATDVLELEGVAAIVLDHVEGPTLDEFVASHQLDEPSIDALASGLFDAVGWLHTNGVVHRHLKSTNVIIDLGGEVAVPRVTDFTLARVLGKPVRQRKRRRVFGTPQFMSPEQTIDSDQVDPRSDLWSLGCVLYHLCTGALAFDGDTVEETYEAVRSGVYVPLLSRLPGAPPRWARALEAALVVDPSERIGTAVELADRWFGGAVERPKMLAKSAPVGRIALVFTDVEGSTRVWEAREELARHSLGAHDAVMRSVLHRHGGYEVKTEGDSFMVAFANPERAVRFCLDVQRALHDHPWSPDLLALPETGEAPGFRGLRVRMGVHVGEPEARVRGQRVDYFGPMVNRAARVAHAGHGGQVLVSGETWALVEEGLADEVDVRALGAFRLRGLAGTQEILQVLPPELAERSFLPIRASSA